MSAPIITGLIARFVDRFPALSGVQAGQQLIDSGAAFTVAGPNNTTVAIPRVQPVAAFKLATLPRNIAAGAAPTCGAVNLSWQAPLAQPGANYHLRFATSPAQPSGNGQSLGAVNSFVLTGLSAPIVLQIRTQDSVGLSEWSDSIAATPTPCAPAAIASIQFVGPSSQCGDLTYLNCRTVQWSSAANATRYELEHTFSTVFTGRPTQTVITTSDSVRYGLVKIRACNTACGPWSETLSVGPGPNE